MRDRALIGSRLPGYGFNGDMAVTMTIEEILKQLTSPSHIPRAALRGAFEQREAITPHLLAALEKVADDPARYALNNEDMLHMFALDLVAQFRETRAFPIIIRILSIPEAILVELVGEGSTDVLARILASTYAGESEPIRHLIEDPGAGEWSRAIGVRAFVILGRAGLVPTAEVQEYLRSLFDGKLPRDGSIAWFELAVGVAALPAPDLLETLRHAYEEGRVDPDVVTFEQLERELKLWPGPIHDDLFAEYRLAGDVLAETEEWARSGGDGAIPKLWDFDPDSEMFDTLCGPEGGVAGLPVRSPPKIGRNDPCPCGSGKKYKKCCG